MLADADVEFHRGEYLRLHATLVDASERTHLPDEPSADTRMALNALLLSLRLGNRQALAA